MVEYPPCNCEGPVKNPINLERKSYLDCSSDTHCTRREFGSVTYWLQTLRRLETMDASEIYSKRLNAKEVIFPKQGEFFPIADGRIKPLGGDQALEIINLGAAATNSRGKSHWFSWRIRTVSSTTSTTRFRMPVKQLRIFWSMSGNFKNRHHVESRVKLYSPREESSPVPLKYIDVTRTTHTNWMSSKRSALMIIGTLMVLETCLILGQVSHNLLYSKKKAPDGYMWSGERLTRKQLTSRPGSFMARILGQSGRECQAEGGAKVV